MFTKYGGRGEVLDRVHPGATRGGETPTTSIHHLEAQSAKNFHMEAFKYNESQHQPFSAVAHYPDDVA